jgi:Ca2+-binding EF-hand superfamily protein
MNTVKSKRLLIQASGFMLLALPVCFADDRGDAFKQMDTDGDGRITRTEHAVVAQRIFDQLDSNADGLITTVEMEARKDSKMGAWDKNEGLSAAEKVAEIDENLDGQVSQGEHEAGIALIFGRLDTDNDGYLSRAECEAGHRVIKKDKK